jgi:hypothetical protein
MKVALIAIGILVGATICGSILRFAKKKTRWRLLQLLGAACLGIVVLTHIAEAFHVFPEMGWGEPTSAGHYLDLTSAVLGIILLPLGYIADALSAPSSTIRRMKARRSPRRSL